MPLNRLLLLSLVTCLAAQDDPDAVLQRARVKVLQSLGRLPKYLCTEVTERKASTPVQRQSPKSCEELNALRQKPSWRLSNVTIDRLRLDVAVGEHNAEMYSWAGDSHFTEKRLSDLVTEGTVQSGTYLSILKMVFSTDSAVITYRGPVTDRGRPLLEYAFTVAAKTSHWQLSDRGRPDEHWAVPYEGTFLIDPATSDLVRLSEHADQFPAAFHDCEVSNVLQYKRVRLGETDFLLPAESRLTIVEADGQETENRTVFSACHEFLGESTISFDTAPEAAAGSSSRAADSRVRDLPPGLPFALSFAKDINLETAAAGDALVAVLASPLKDHSRVLAPKGAPVTVRVVGLRYRAGYISAALTLRLETVQVDGIPVSLSASPVCPSTRVPPGRPLCRSFKDDPYEVQLQFLGGVGRTISHSSLESNWITRQPR